MRSILLFAILTFTVTIGYGQCTSTAGFVCLPQTDVDRISKDLTDYKALKDTYAKLLSERALTDAERQAAAILIKSWQDAFDARGKIVTDQQTIIDIQAKAIQLYSDLVQKLTTQINQPKSSFQKFMDVLKNIGILAAGIALGRGGL